MLPDGNNFMNLALTQFTQVQKQCQVFVAGKTELGSQRKISYTWSQDGTSNQGGSTSFRLLTVLFLVSDHVPSMWRTTPPHCHSLWFMSLLLEDSSLWVFGISAHFVSAWKTGVGSPSRQWVGLLLGQNNKDAIFLGMAGQSVCYRHTIMNQGKCGVPQRSKMPGGMGLENALELLRLNTPML